MKNFITLSIATMLLVGCAGNEPHDSIDSVYLNNPYRFLAMDSKKEYEKIIIQLTNHIEVDKRAIYALNNRALAYSESGMSQKAISDLELVLKLSPKSYVPYHNLGDIYQEKGNLERALELYSDAIGRFPDDAVCFRARAYAYFESGRWIEAIRDFDSALKLESNQKQNYLDRASAKEKIGDKDGAKRDREIASHLKNQYLYLN